MITFIQEHFLLQNKSAERLYHDYAENLPIIDFHSHLPAHLILNTHHFSNIHEAWLSADTHKWRAMRGNGIAEKFCTGLASPREKFQAWAQTVPKTLGNPLFHWTHLELARFFGIKDCFLNPETAEKIWQETNAQLQEKDFSVSALMKKTQVKVMYATEDPLNSLEAYQGRADLNLLLKPAFRPDKALAVETPAIFNAWVDALAKVVGKRIGGYHDFLNALKKRHDYFHQMGCRLAHHGVETMSCAEYSDQKISLIFGEIRAGNPLNDKKIAQFKTAVLFQLCQLNCQKKWVQQFHIGLMRNCNTRLKVGLIGDAGFDAIADKHYAKKLVSFLNALDENNQLAKTILYGFNPTDQDMLASVCTTFQDGSFPGKVQCGAGWWLLGQTRSIEHQLDSFANLGLLSNFIGISSGTRSVLSYSRHEYFRRALCNWLGQDIERGLIPRDFAWVGQVIQDICYKNVCRYLDLELPA